MTMTIVGVTACISGVAHTYMAAEVLEKSAAKMGYKAIVETQGALGSENTLTQDVIDNADVVFIIADINIEGEERFSNARVLKISIGEFLREPQQAMSVAEKLRHAPRQTEFRR